jgi:GWxTD domain-containing protein
VPAAAAKGTVEGEADLKSWIDGPVRYITDKRQTKTFRRLKTNEQRAVFIERFWDLQDPSPGTLVNERRQIFWQRVHEANSNFLDSAKPGWRTDRGKIHILHGAPTEIQEDLSLHTQAIPTGGHGVIRWIYEGRPEQRTDLDPIVVVPFVRDSGGEWRLTYDPELASVFFDPTAIREKSFAQKMMERYDRLRGVTQTRSELSVMLDLGRMQEVPPQEQLLLERVETAEAYETDPLDVRLDRFIHYGAQAPLIVTTVDVSMTAPGSDPAVIARFVPLDASRASRILGEGSFRVETRDGRRYAQGRLVIDPGTYVVTVMVADPVRVANRMFRGRVTVPESSETLRLSDVVLVREMDALPYASLASYDEAFIVGAFRVYPRFRAEIPRGSPVRLFYEVYDATLPLTVRYTLEGLERDGTWVALGAPQEGVSAAAGQGWELPTAPTWPPGDYRVRLEVVDAEGRRVATDVPFTLREPAELADGVLDPA